MTNPAQEANIPTSMATIEAGGSVKAFRPQTFDEAYRLCNLLASQGGDMVPKAFTGKPGAIWAVTSLGAEKGMSMMASLQYIAVINGRPTIWGDAIPAMIQHHGHTIHEELTGEGDKMVASCTITRKDTGQEITRTFSVEDAKRAGLWKTKPDATPWWKYPKRMLQMRARGFAARDGVADVMVGLSVAEEVQDFQPMKDVSPQESTSGFAQMANKARLAAARGDIPDTAGEGEAIDGEVEEIEPEIDREAEPYKSGKFAAESGFSRGDCPMDMTSEEQTLWFVGYDENVPEEDETEEGQD